MKKIMSLFLCIVILLATFSPSFGESGTNWRIQQLIDSGLKSTKL